MRGAIYVLFRIASTLAYTVASVCLASTSNPTYTRPRTFTTQNTQPIMPQRGKIHRRNAYQDSLVLTSVRVCKSLSEIRGVGGDPSLLRAV